MRVRDLTLAVGLLLLGGLTATTATSTGSMFWRDTEAPSVLTAFSAATGGSAGQISVTVDFPVAPTLNDYHKVEVRRLAGASAPNAACTDGVVAKTYNLGGFTDETFTDSGLTSGAACFYRACITDGVGNLTSTQTVLNRLAGAAPIVVSSGTNNGSCNTACSGVGRTCIDIGTDAGATNNVYTPGVGCTTSGGGTCASLSWFFCSHNCLCQ
jgi:hypothetical protein